MMFKEWGFLLTEIWVLLVLSALVGLLAGWIIWGGRRGAEDRRDDAPWEQAQNARAAARPAEQGDDFSDIPAMQGGGYARPTAKPVLQTASAPSEAVPSVSEPSEPTQVANLDLPLDPTPTPPTPTKAVDVPTPPDAPDGPIGAKPAGLAEARDGLPDDLTKIKGIGPKMEKLCNRLGFWHYDQIAAWTQDEVAWVDDNLEGFKGRVTRDAWVAQAKALSPNATPAFVRRKS